MTEVAPTAVLDRLLAEMGSVVVAFSGGVDSTYLALRAHQVLGARALAVTADSESLASDQRERALDLARQFRFAHAVIRTDEVADPLYAANGPDRCYHCKTELFRHLLPLAAAHGLEHVAYGLVTDDLTDFRPGHRAAREAGVRSPLVEAGLAKAEVRTASRALGLPTWDLPASPCLASRVAYGTAITPDVLSQVDRAEAAVRALGFREFRVRHRGRSARVEIAPREMGRLDEPGLREAVLASVAVSGGYEGVDLDPRGYRRGRLNEELAVWPSPDPGV